MFAAVKCQQSRLLNFLYLLVSIHGFVIIGHCLSFFKTKVNLHHVFDMVNHFVNLVVTSTSLFIRGRAVVGEPLHVPSRNGENVQLLKTLSPAGPFPSKRIILPNIIVIPEPNVIQIVFKAALLS